MSKFLIFSLLWWLTGNPFVALIVLLFVIYFIDRRYIGLTPSILRPLRRSRRLAALLAELRAGPHHTSNRLEAARLLMEQKKYQKALGFLGMVAERMEDSAEVRYDEGVCLLHLGQLEAGERLILQSLDIQPRLRYGEPYLRLGEAFAGPDPEKAIDYLEKFGGVHSSSCEAYYLLGRLYARMGRKAEAARAYREVLNIYRSLPRYMRRTSRRWALLARLKG